MKKLFVVLVALSLVGVFSAALYAGSILGSAHDFSGQPFAGGQICIVCHAPHNVSTDPLIPPLWNHELSTATYQVYSSPTLDAGPLGQPSGSTKLCLSCHDGTVAIDSFGGNTGSFFVQGDANLETDLRNDHPISFIYDTALANTDGLLRDPSTVTVTIGQGDFTKTGTIQDVLLQDDLLQCGACHAVHNDFVVSDAPSAGKLLKISAAASEICLACHRFSPEP